MAAAGVTRTSENSTARTTRRDMSVSSFAWRDTTSPTESGTPRVSPRACLSSGSWWQLLSPGRRPVSIPPAEPAPGRCAPLGDRHPSRLLLVGCRPRELGGHSALTRGAGFLWQNAGGSPRLVSGVVDRARVGDRAAPRVTRQGTGFPTPVARAAAFAPHHRG